MTRTPVVIGIVGGLVDVVSGAVLLADTNSMGSPIGMMGPPSAIWSGLFLLVLGIVVLVTTLLMASEQAARAPSTFRLLMIGYGIAMLTLGASMIAGLFSMASGSFLSGGAMIVVGAAMLVSAAFMRNGMGRTVPPQP